VDTTITLEQYFAYVEVLDTLAEAREILVSDGLPTAGLDSLIKWYEKKVKFFEENSEVIE